MTISVIIAVYNEAPYITSCLKSILSQSHLPDEVIIVDDGSTDKSEAKIRNFQLETKSRFKYIKQKHQGPARARNLGAKKSRGDILVFLDADQTFERNFIKEITKPILAKKALATFTRSETVGNLDNTWARFWDDVTFNNSGTRMPKSQDDRSFAFRAVVRRLFMRAGGYDSYGNTDDASLLKKVHQTALAADLAHCYHANPSSLSEVFYSARWMGRDIHNRGKWQLLFIFSPFWSFVKGVQQALSKKDMRFLLFRLVFDLGYLLGYLDIQQSNLHYK